MSIFGNGDIDVYQDGSEGTEAGHPLWSKQASVKHSRERISAINRNAGVNTRLFSVG
jgi:hypothetical protein